MSILLLLAIPILLSGAIGSILLRDNRASALTSILSQLIAVMLVLKEGLPIALGGREASLRLEWPPPVDHMVFRVDALSAFFLSWSLPMTLLGTLYAAGYLRPYYIKGRHGGPHFALLNLVSVSFILIYSAQNALVFLMGWEIAAVSAWLLVIWDYGNQRIRFAGFNYLVSTHIGLFVLVAAFMLLHSKTDSMDFQDFAVFLSHQSPSRGTIFLLLGVSFALKSAFFPFHTWLPRAHSAAPAHVSALMSGVIHKAGLFAFLRFTLFLGEPEEWMGWAVLGFGALSAFFGVLYTSSQRDLKRLLGYSSTENVGIAAMGFGVGYLGLAWKIPSLAALGFAGGLLHILNHAIFKCLLFYAAGAVYYAAHTVDLERLGGLAKRIPRTALFFLIGALAISALPPLNGFISEFIIYSGFFSGSAPSPLSNIILIAAAALLAFVGGVSALSMTRVFGLAFLGAPRDARVHLTEEEPPSMQAPMLIHAAGAVLFGVAPELGFRLIGSVLGLFSLAGAINLSELLAPMLWASRLVTIGLLLVGVLAWRKKTEYSETWGCGYTAATPKMQYTGSSFTEQFARIFNVFLPSMRREKLPEKLFPPGEGSFSTHHFDAVEHRMFEVLGQSEEFVSHAADRISEQPRFSFAAGLIVLLVLGAIIVGGAQ